jgi:hypothetical protein
MEGLLAQVCVRSPWHNGSDALPLPCHPMTSSRRTMLSGAAALALLAACVPSGAVLSDGPPDKVSLHTRRLPLHLENDKARRVGKLAWRGGIAVTADHAAVGGWSDLWIAADGGSLRAVSDRGSWLAADLRYDGGGELTGIGNAALGGLRGRDGAWLRGTPGGDAESMAMLPDGSMLVGFERRHRILRYPAGDARRGGGLAAVPTAFPVPAGLLNAPGNSGLEAMTVLPDGRLFLLTEGHAVVPGTAAGWIGDLHGGTPRWHAFHYALAGSFRPTAAAALPDGDIVLLERTVGLPGGWRIRVMRLRAASLRPDAVVHAEELARLATPWITENLEGIAARRNAAGETLLWLVSDDNFMFLQRTVLLHFALTD